MKMHQSLWQLKEGKMTLSLGVKDEKSKNFFHKIKNQTKKCDSHKVMIEASWYQKKIFFLKWIKLSFFSFHKKILKFFKKEKMRSACLSHKTNQMSLLWAKDESNSCFFCWVKKNCKKKEDAFFLKIWVLCFLPLLHFLRYEI